MRIPPVPQAEAQMMKPQASRAETAGFRKAERLHMKALQAEKVSLFLPEKSEVQPASSLRIQVPELLPVPSGNKRFQVIWKY